MNNYVIAIGGTGQHAALCLLDYLALAHYTTNGKFPVRQDAWKVILIDADQEKTQEERSAWAHCREQAKRLSDAGLSIATSAHKPVETLDHTFGDTTTASLLMRLANSPDVAELLLDLLFTPEQGKVRVMDGFFGEPRVAAFVGGRWLRSVTGDAHHDLGALAGALGASPQEVRVGVVGSSAGGTGAGLLDPVRRWLMSISKQAAGSVCIDVGLEWFKIAGTRHNALSTRMRHNAASCLFPFLKTGNTHSLAIWGHPSVGAATEESDQNDTRQAAKKNVTLPWYGASVLADFFGRANMPRNAALAVDKVSLKSLSTPFHNLTELVESNRHVIGRLEHTLAYAKNPYEGAVLPLPPFGNIGRVPQLDSVERPRFAARLDALIKAKREALARIEESEVLNKAGQLPVAPHAITSIRALNRLYAKDADPVACSEPQGQAIPNGSTQARLLPEHAIPAGTAQPSAFPCGTLVEITQTERSGLADLDLIAASRIPSLAGVHDLISAFMGSQEVWKGSLALAGKPVAPAVFRRPTDDRGHDWMRRWLLVIRALMAGALRRHKIEDVPDALRHDLTDAGVNLSGILLYELRGEEYVIGYLDPDFLCIPSLGRIWENENALHALGEQSGGISRLITWVNLTNKLVGKGKSPDWAKLIESEFKGAMFLQTLNAGKETVDVRWGDAEIVSLPLPAESGTKRLDDTVRNIKVDKDAEPPEDIVEKLAEHAIGKATYLRSDLKRAFNAGFHGSVIVNDKGESVSLSGASLLGDDDLFTPVTVQLKGCRVPYTLPVKVEHAPHIASCSYVSVGTSLKVTLTLRNKAESTVTKTYTPEEIVNDTKSKTSLYLWPRIAGEMQRGLWTLITGEGNIERDVRVLSTEGDLVISDDKGTTVVSFPTAIEAETDWMQLGKRSRVSRVRRVVTASSNPKRRPSLVSVRIAAGTGESTEGGLVPYVPEAPAQSEWTNERWCVDFGTSSTVVAVHRKEHEKDDKVVLKISGVVDSTIAALTGVGVPGDNLQWFDTWDGQGPIRGELAGEMPSYVLVLNNDQKPQPELGVDYAVDLSWRLEKWKAVLGYAIRDRLKWSADPLRAAYNRHVLETILQVRLRVGGKLPAQLPITFTVPYRQITTLDNFESALTKAINDVKSSFGIEIKPEFLWESHALRPHAVTIPSGIFVAADLGGGTLDMYAARYRADERGIRVIAEEMIDSAAVGADHLVRSWCAVNQFPELSNETVPYKIAIRSRHISTEQLHTANDTKYAQRYWRTLRRYIALWCDAVSAHWTEDGVAPTTVTFERLGLGWELYDRAGLADWTRTLGDTAKELGFAVRFQEESSRTGGRSRKEELAYRALWRQPVASIEELKKAQPNMVLGIALRAGSETREAYSLLHDLKPVKGGMQPADLDDIKQKLDASPAVIRTLLEQLNNDEGTGGGKITTSGDVKRLSTSPLTLLAERLIEESA
jgi:hypothetical protein